MTLHKYIFSGTYSKNIYWILSQVGEPLSDGIHFKTKDAALAYCDKNNIEVSEGGVFSNYKCYGEPTK